METVLFVCSVIACIVGVFTFVVGMNARSKEDGVLVQKIDQAIKGIEELKTDVKGVSQNQHNIALKVNSNEERIHTIFEQLHQQETIEKSLLAISETLLKMSEGGPQS